MKKNKKKPFLPRLPMEAVEVLRKKGGPQGRRKGKKGYNRKRENKSSQKIDQL